MNYIVIAVGMCLMAQGQGAWNDTAPIQTQRGHRSAPAAAAPPAQEPGWPPQQPAAEAAPLSDPYGQPPVAQPTVKARRSEPASEATEPLQSLGAQPRQRLRPPELIAEALENPKQAAIVGTPMTLAEVLSKIPNRQSQLQATKSYWRLAAAQAAYHWSLEQRDILRDQTRQHTNQPSTLSARAAARADVRDAQLAVENAQTEIASLIGNGAERITPLASDRPHVGDYTTNVKGLFGNRQPPARLQLLNRTLPVRRKSIDAHGEAIVAALDAVEATGEQFRTTGQGLSTLLDSIDQLRHQRQEFIAEVRDYNIDIADFAFTVAEVAFGPGGAPVDTLVSMMIRTTPPLTARSPNREQDPANPSIRRANRPDPETGASPEPATPRSEDGAALSSPRISGQWTVNYQGTPPASDDVGWYEGLLDVASQPVRVQKLGNLLHWDRNLPPEAGRPVMLAECLRDAPPQNRLAVIQAFWQARQQAAELQLIYDHMEQLNSLQSLAIPQPGYPYSAEVGVRLQSARQSLKASILDAQVDLLAAQFTLMQSLGRSSDATWLLPATAPQSGRFMVSSRARHGHARGSLWAERMTLYYDKLQHRADAVMQCDAYRAQLLREARHPTTQPAATDNQMTALDQVMWAINRQNQQARGFLQDLTEYNMAIANYALVTLPETVSGDQLAGKLAIPRSTVRES